MAFEYQGEQHYNPRSWVFANKQDFEHQQYRDQVKRKACIDMGIRLIEIPHFVSNTDEELIAYICSELDRKNLLNKTHLLDMEPFYSLVISSLKKLRHFAESKGGKCLAKSYINSNTKILWECAEGHHWEAAPNNIINQKQWCPICANRLPLGIDTMQAIAENFGGKCLSTEYINNETKLIWQCDKGHIWEAIPSNIARNHWCPHCAGKAKGTIEEMHELAASKGGKLKIKEIKRTIARLHTISRLKQTFLNKKV